MKKYSNLFFYAAGLFFFSSFRWAKAGSDVNQCFEFQKKLVEQFGREAPTYHWFPRCSEGGYWRNVQCDVYGCFCAYVDTGLMIPDTIENGLLEYMEEHCPIKSAQPPDVCSSPPPDYPCRQTERRYYYNEATRRCESNSRSCLGFRDVADCRDACMMETRDRCNFRENKGRKCDRRGPQERWYHDEVKGICRPFLYEGCGGNSNNYREKWQCLKACEQRQSEELVIQVGKTKYIIRLPTWLVVQHLLVPSANNVLSVDKFKQIEAYMEEISELPDKEEPRESPKDPECRAEHAKKNQTRREICSLPKHTGPCRAYIPRWYFDGTKCTRFVYGGCLPNANNFKTPSCCTEFCRATIPPSEADTIEEMIITGTAKPKDKYPEKPTGERALDNKGDGLVLGQEDIEFEFGGSDGGSNP